MTQAADLSARGRSAAADRAFFLLSLAGAGAVFVVFALILATTVTQSWPAFSLTGLDFVLSKDWIPLELNGNPPHYGALAFIYGTAVTSGIALLLAVPVSIGIALFLTEYARHGSVRLW